MIEPLIDLVRPLRLRGAGRLFDRFTPWEGARRITIAGNITMRVDLSDGQQRQMFMGCFARPVEKLIRAVLRRGDVFLDVGANVGYFSLLGAHLVGSAGRVIAVEPYRPSFDALAREVAHNRLEHVAMHNVALSSSGVSLTLYAPAEHEHRNFNVSVVPSASGVAIDVPAITLDDALDRWKRSSVRLMKIDVEGAEPLVLEGGAKSLSRGVVHAVICEINGKYLVRRGSSPMALVARLRDLGFNPATLRFGRLRENRAALDPLPDEESDWLFVHRHPCS